MAFGLGRLRLPSKDFWAMTPHELAAALRGCAAHLPAESMRRADLARLMDDFPDEAR